MFQKTLNPKSSELFLLPLLTMLLNMTSDKGLFCSLAVHPDRITIATGQVAGTSKDGKVSLPVFYN